MILFEIIQPVAVPCRIRSLEPPLKPVSYCVFLYLGAALVSSAWAAGSVADTYKKHID